MENVSKVICMWDLLKTDYFYCEKMLLE